MTRKVAFIDATTATDGQVLAWDADMGRWKPVSSSGGGPHTHTESQITDLTTPARFFVANNNSNTQVTTGTFAVLAGMWDTPTHTHNNYSWDDGIVTFNANATVTINIQVLSWNNANNRHQLDVDVQLDTGSGYVTVAASASYTSRNNTQDTGVTVINGLIVDVSEGDTMRLRVRDVGVAATISGTTPFASGATTWIGIQ